MQIYTMKQIKVCADVHVGNRTVYAGIIKSNCIIHQIPMHFTVYIMPPSQIVLKVLYLQNLISIKCMNLQ